MTSKKMLSIMLLTALFSSVTFGMFMLPTAVPVDRLIKNTTAYIKENPEDTNAYYTLGRIHYLAFANKSGLVGAYEREALPTIPQDWLQEPALSRQNGAQKLEGKELYEHANEAMKYFNKVIEMDPENGLYYHGLACLIEQYTKHLDEIKSEVVPEEFRKVFLEQAKQYYFKAFSLSIKEDSELSNKPMSGLRSLVSFEAGKSYARLVDSGTSDEQKQKNLKEVKAGLEKLENIPESRIVTPVIFSINQNQKLNQLLAPNQNVQFDLDGDGLKETWSWVKPETGILVWDPENKAKITSGIQLFGSVSWWMFYEDGYKALNALDDNRDGILTGSELEGIRVWFDRNSNGTSEKDEVVDLAKLNITNIGTISTGKQDGMPMCETGIKFFDGTIVTTYDWTTSQVK